MARVKAEEVPQPKPQQQQQRNQNNAQRSKGKKTLAADYTRVPPPNKQGKAPNQQRAPKQYSFKEEHVDTLFQLLRKNNKLQLPEVRKPDEAGKVDDPNYCRYHKFLGHPTRKCYVFKDILQNLVNANVLTLKPEQKTVSLLKWGWQNVAPGDN